MSSVNDDGCCWRTEAVASSDRDALRPEGDHRYRDATAPLLEAVRAKSRMQLRTTIADGMRRTCARAVSNMRTQVFVDVPCKPTRCCRVDGGTEISCTCYDGFVFETVISQVGRSGVCGLQPPDHDGCSFLESSMHAGRADLL